MYIFCIWNSKDGLQLFWSVMAIVVQVIDVAPVPLDALLSCNVFKFLFYNVFKTLYIAICLSFRFVMCSRSFQLHCVELPLHCGIFKFLFIFVSLFSIATTTTPTTTTMTNRPTTSTTQAPPTSSTPGGTKVHV